MKVVPGLFSLSSSVTLALCAALTGACTMAIDSAGGDFVDPDDPAGALGDDEDQWLDEGPPPEDETSDKEDATGVDISLAAPPNFQMPFPCAQVWAGQTRSNHIPRLSVDFNRFDDHGDLVVASAAGYISRIENEGNVSYGRWIEIDHGNGFRTRYAHLSRQDVELWQTVNKGQAIGLVGNTGGSTGPHLHYEQRHNGQAVAARFNTEPAAYDATINYWSQNSCGGTGGGSESTSTGRVDTPGGSLTVRAGAGVNTQPLGYLADGSYVTIGCQRYGDTVEGTYGTSNLWNKIDSGYISDSYTYTGSDAPVMPLCE